MIKIQYLHYGIEGTRYLNCEILEVKNGLYYILLDNESKLWVKKEELKFPKFSDLII